MSGPLRSKVLFALLGIYLFWGSTYLGIHYVLESMPPLLTAALRNTIAGLILIAAMKLSGLSWPSWAEWKRAAVIGCLLLVGGNGSVTWAQKRVSTGLAALVVGSVPLWVVAFEWLRKGGSRPSRSALMGLLTGFVGLAILLAPTKSNGLHVDFWGALTLLVGCASWAVGSLYSRDRKSSAPPLFTTGISMLCGGLVLLVMSTLSGELAGFNPSKVSQKSLFAFVYLICFGSIFGFSAYNWLLRNTSTAKVVTYAYVNPVVAVFLGWLFLDEPLTLRVIVAALVILSGVVLITSLPFLRGEWEQLRARQQARSKANAVPTPMSQDL